MDSRDGHLRLPAPDASSRPWPVPPPDPTGFKGDASNLDRYRGNDPIDKSDPMGLENPAAALVHGGSFWAMQKYFDSSNTSHLEYNDWMNAARPQAGMGEMGGGGGAPEGGGSKSISPESEGNIMHTYFLKPGYNIGDLAGARGYQYVSDPNKKVNGQCLAGVQHLSGTPSSSTPLVRGPL